VTAVVPANIGLVAGGKNAEEAKKFIAFTVSRRPATAVRPEDLAPADPAARGDGRQDAAGLPQPFEIAKRAKVQFDSDLSESRYNVVSALFDQTITFRLKELQAATKAIHAAEAALAKKPNAAGGCAAEGGARRRLHAGGRRRPRWPTRSSWPSSPPARRTRGEQARHGAGGPLEHQRAQNYERARPAPGRAGPGRGPLKPLGPPSAARAPAPGWPAPWCWPSCCCSWCCRSAACSHRLRRGRRHAHAGPLRRLLLAGADEGGLLQQPDVALMSALFAALIAVPLAYFTVRFDFRGALLIQTLGVLPLIMPPFVGAVAMQLIFGRSGSVNLLLGDALRLHAADHGGAQRRHLRRGHPLLPVHPDEPDGGAAQHRRRDGRGGDEPGLPRLAAVLARDLPARRCRASWPGRRWCS
jgi:hypothetical protein